MKSQRNELCEEESEERRSRERASIGRGGETRARKEKRNKLRNKWNPAGKDVL